ncbi:MAG: TraR/DksA C4-type zinc finger protein [Myxococcota bacterium]
MSTFKPQADPDSELTQVQIEALYEQLTRERVRVTEGMDARMSEAISDVDPLADEVDIAQRHTEQAYLMRFADKEQKLLKEIAHALDKMKSGEYGVCEGTGEPIGYKRLEVRPWTRYSVEYKEELERDRSQRRAS